MNEGEYTVEIHRELRATMKAAFRSASGTCISATTNTEPVMARVITAGKADSFMENLAVMGHPILFLGRHGIRQTPAFVNKRKGPSSSPHFPKATGHPPAPVPPTPPASTPVGQPGANRSIFRPDLIALPFFAGGRRDKKKCDRSPHCRAD